ncbi:hypothetical protein RUM44_002347 [Polyplax serrata]|uniref:ornithine decarboxylase n=1 Tax=Polyplax serrata TaxID=468196 RepID=A0ABR1AML3_POLSC
MKQGIVNERIHVLEASADVWKIIRDIVATCNQEEAFFVCDVGEIVKKFNEWKVKFPRVQPFYAVKCNDTPIVIECLAALGASFDCASKGELAKILDLGVDPSRIIFANPCKPMSHIQFAESNKVDLITFDNETELYKMKSLFPDARLVLRIRYDAEVATCQLGMKFGCDHKKEAPKLINTARSLGLNIVGISFHVGSGCGDPPVYRKAISACRGLFDYAKTVGYEFTMLDIGGGFPGNKKSTVDKFSTVVNQAIDDFFPEPEVNIIAEPGRFMTASCFTLVTNIHSKRTVAGENGVHNMYYINDGVYGSFNSIIYDHAHVNPIPLKSNTKKSTSASIWGPTCDGLDQVCDSILLPEMDIGDWIVFEDMGAYTLPVASPFNGFPVPRVYVVASQSIWKLLKDTVPFCDDDFVISTDHAKINATIPFSSVIEDSLAQNAFQFMNITMFH